MKRIGSYVLAKGMAALLAAAAIGGGTVHAGSILTKSGLLSGDEAANFAVMDAGVETEEISGMQSSLERDDGQYVYDIKFYVGSVKYEYEIRAEDGAVLEKEIENGNRNENRAEAAAEKAPAASAGIAGTQDTPGTKDITGTQDTADPKNASGTKDASDAQDTPGTKDTSGAQNLNGEQKNTNSLPDEGAQTEGLYISVDRAKQIALEDAGLSESDVRFSTAKFEEDDDDGEEYEIEFYYGQYEYEYDIDAVTGKILESSVELDDD